MMLESAISAHYAEQTRRAQEEARRARLDLAVHKAAAQFGADPAKLLDSRSFIESLNDVSPSDADTIGERVKEAVATNSDFRAPAVRVLPAAETSPPVSLQAAVAGAMQRPGTAAAPPGGDTAA